jgi:hypothetical protein
MWNPPRDSIVAPSGHARTMGGDPNRFHLSSDEYKIENINTVVGIHILPK